jgi:hypothetical protein
MAKCAYCEQNGKVTREEVMPLFLSRNRPAYRTVIDHQRRVVRAGLVTAVRDVCEDCNGGPLSRLDNYASGLDRRYFTQIVGTTQMIDFSYDFDLLLRWLLKVSYNDDRTRPPPHDTKPFVPYILGREKEPPFSTSVLVGIITPGVTPTEQVARGFPELIEPESCGIGYLAYGEPALSDTQFSRFVQVNSYLLDVIAWRPKVSRPIRRRHVEQICRIHHMVELKRNTNTVAVTAGIMDYLSFQSKFFPQTSTYRDARR